MYKQWGGVQVTATNKSASGHYYDRGLLPMTFPNEIYSAAAWAGNGGNCTLTSGTLYVDYYYFETYSPVPTNVNTIRARYICIGK